ncbi:MAG: DUF1559 domain-containing protein, partial [Gemmataceae bacterium]|nr:DUF1559 domain-containing protein [Gemmataceae bacterium]
MTSHSRRSGFSLIELLVVIAIIAILAALIMSGVQKARTARDKVYCVNNLRQMGIGLHSHHSQYGAFPPGCTGGAAPQWQAWMAKILPFIEQDNVWKQSKAAYASGAWPWGDPHPRDLVLSIYTCPMEKRVLQAQYAQGVRIALTSYLGVNGTNHSANNGVLYNITPVRSMDITDGPSNTLMVGERPPSADMI